MFSFERKGNGAVRTLDNEYLSIFISQGNVDAVRAESDCSYG